MPHSSAMSLEAKRNTDKTSGMDAIAKVLRYIDENGLKDSEFMALAKIPLGTLSRFRDGSKKITLPLAIRSARAIGTTLDWLCDDSDESWPPPKGEEKGERLSEAQRRVLLLAEEACFVADRSVDPELYEARRRLMTPAAATARPTELAPDRESYEQGRDQARVAEANPPKGPAANPGNANRRPAGGKGA